MEPEPPVIFIQNYSKTINTNMTPTSARQNQKLISVIFGSIGESNLELRAEAKDKIDESELREIAQ